MVEFSATVLGSLRQSVDAACADPKSGIPGSTVVVVGRDGKELFAHCAGKRGVNSDEPMTLDNIYWIASCTKIIVGIACMQLAERGILALDDSDQLESLCPELKEVKVLQDDGTLVEKRRGITLRMLLTHTAGFGYTFFNDKLRDYSFPIGYDEFDGSMYDMLQPLVNQPGEGWEYGINIDWAGIALERITHLSLNQYLHDYIFQPLGLKNISMVPTRPMKSKLAYMNQRSSDGSLMSRDHLLRKPLVVETTAEIASCFNSGGAGCFAKPQDYCQILATLLNNGTCPTTGARILQESTVNEMFRNQIKDFPDFGRQGLQASKPDLTNPIPELYPVSGNPPQGWGLTMMLSNGGATGRSASTGFWAGLPNLWWWCDREKGVAGMVCTQILPFADAKVLGLWVDIESKVYAALTG
ncbi:beta-lactamase family protein [Coleophoma cylindrospora]|uniref:Beta-lactamase family protein n=1 Tax=Coleophoma cylindrospora TaxID=1849047 RepID=A0A3D8RV15_9HELO|nr:beta-lactamase family protein [Coleophoma cylindrospora]